MWNLDLDGITLIFVTLLFNFILVLGLYLAINFVRKWITLGKSQAKYMELIVGIILTVLGFYLKFGLLA
jgi:threonine/homoserine/homoserine lactone efflux protein